eukprot:scaffold2353_cov167-Amphora_coffeaeformis.AAC.75
MVQSASTVVSLVPPASSTLNSGGHSVPVSAVKFSHCCVAWEHVFPSESVRLNVSATLSATSILGAANPYPPRLLLPAYRTSVTVPSCAAQEVPARADAVTVEEFP